MCGLECAKVSLLSLAGKVFLFQLRVLARTKKKNLFKIVAHRRASERAKEREREKNRLAMDLQYSFFILLIHSLARLFVCFECARQRKPCDLFASFVSSISINLIELVWFYSRHWLTHRRRRRRQRIINENVGISISLVVVVVEVEVDFGVLICCLCANLLTCVV